MLSFLSGLFQEPFKRISETQQQSTTRTNEGEFLLYSGARFTNQCNYVPILLAQPTDLCLNHDYKELKTLTHVRELWQGM